MASSIGYIAMVPSGRFGAPGWALVRSGSIAPTPLPEGSTREDVRRALDRTGLRLCGDDKVERAPGPGPRDAA